MLSLRDNINEDADWCVCKQMRNKLTQKELVFYKLYKSYKENKEKFVAVWEFVGEIHIEELHRWELMSYTCVHRAFEIFDENPGLVERRWITGKSGSHYYQYRFAPNASAEKIMDTKLASFYRKIKNASKL